MKNVKLTLILNNNNYLLSKKNKLAKNPEFKKAKNLQHKLRSATQRTFGSSSFPSNSVVQKYNIDIKGHK